MKPIKNAEPEDMEIIRPPNEPVTGLHYIFWNPPEGVIDTFDEYELKPTFDVYWSSKAADAAMRRYKRDGISVHRIDYPLEKLDQTSQEGLYLLTQLPIKERNTIWYLFLRHVFAERRWQHWLNEGRPEEDKTPPERKV